MLFIDNHLFEDLSLERIAKHAALSEATVVRMFKREMETTPVKFVRSRRLDEARMLLQAKRYSASELAALLGYNDLAAFSVAFKRAFGTPPGIFQKE